MRELTEKQLAYIFRTGCCPFCGVDEWVQGPSGGMSQNLYCNACGAGINLMGPASHINLGGQVIREPSVQVEPPNLDPPISERGRSFIKRMLEGIGR